MSPEATAEPLKAPKLAAQRPIVHGFFGRIGGVSAGAYASLNVGSRVGDAADAVATNRTRVLQACAGPTKLQWMQQIHGHAHHFVDPSTPQDAPACDALITQVPGLALGVYTADCVPVLLAGPQIVAAVHAGWRGLVAGVIGHAVEAIAKRHPAASPATLIAALGPAIGPCCYAVSPEVAQALGDGERPDLWAVAQRALVAAGVLPTAIDTLRRCTHCDARYFSHRRDRGTTGRQASVVALRA